MRFLAVAIVLAFPILDLLATIRFARWTGIPLWIWLAGGLVAGATLLRTERVAFRARTVAAMHGEASILRDMLDSGRKVLAAFLLMLPGILSDVMALLLLALPLNIGRGEYARQAVGANRASTPRNVFDGDYRRLD